MSEPAYPFTEMHTHGNPYTQWKGMTLRDYFAAQAMQGIQSRVNWSVESIAELAYKQADEMLKARKE